MYVYRFDSSDWITQRATDFYRGLHDFKWTTDYINGREYPMKMLVNDQSYFYIKGTLFTLETNNENINRNDCIDNRIMTCLTYSEGYFELDSHYFYFITYDKDPANYKSGYYKSQASFDYTEVSSLSINTNSTSPLEFYYNFTIQSMTFSRNTRYVLYKIYNTIKEKN